MNYLSTFNHNTSLWQPLLKNLTYVCDPNNKS